MERCFTSPQGIDKEPLYREKLITVAGQLEKWAKESKEGGWSTHQVTPMRDLSKELLNFLAVN